jgi:hypothetical protein
LEPDDDITAIIDRWDAPFADDLDKPIGYFGNEQSIGNMGLHLAEAILEYTRADIATYNLGGVRDSVDSGFITLRDLYHVEPFFNFVATLELPGNVIQSIMGGNYYATEISSFNPATTYTVGSSNFSITSFERSYPSDASNRQDDVAQSVVSTLANYLAIEYPITNTEVLTVMSSVFNAISGLPDSALGGGDPSNLRTTMADILSEADADIIEGYEVEALYNVEYVAAIVDNHVTASCAKRWLSTNLYGIICNLGGPSTSTPFQTSTSTTYLTSPTTGNPSEPLPWSPWALVVVMEIAALVIILAAARIWPKGD